MIIAVPTVRIKTLGGRKYVDLMVSQRVKGKPYPITKVVGYLGPLEKLKDNEQVKLLALKLNALTNLIPIDTKTQDKIIGSIKSYALLKTVKTKLSLLGVMDELQRMDEQEPRRKYKLSRLVPLIISYMLQQGGSKLNMVEQFCSQV